MWLNSAHETTEEELEQNEVLVSRLHTEPDHQATNLLSPKDKAGELERRHESRTRLTTPKILYNSDPLPVALLKTDRKRKASLLESPRRRRAGAWLRTPFVYEPIQEGLIRILNLLPGSSDDPLRGTLEVESINDRPVYKALSYAWGEPTYPHRLHFPQGELQITKSLYGALRRFRSATEPVRLWADAICVCTFLCDLFCSIFVKEFMHPPLVIASMPDYATSANPRFVYGI